MATDEKELLENDLVTWVKEQSTELKPYAQTIIGVAVLLALGLFLLSFMSNRRAQRRDASWKEYYSAAVQRDVTKLMDLANTYAGTSAGLWAMQSAGDIALADGTNMLHRDRDGAMKQFELAKASFEGAVSGADSDLLRQRSLLGLAQACEALSDFEGAKQQYNKVITQWPDESVATIAKRRVDFVDRPNNQEFYTWFLQQKPYIPTVPPGGVPAASGFGPNSTNPFGSVAPPQGSAFDGGIGDTTETPVAEITDEGALDLEKVLEDAEPSAEPSGEPASTGDALPLGEPANDPSGATP